MEEINTTENFPLKMETYQIIGSCMEVHRVLGPGFLEIVYKDALEIEFRARNIPYKRELEYVVDYKGNLLPHRFRADFVVFGQVILEAKAQKALPEEFDHLLLNYLAASKCKVGVLANFGWTSLKHRRLIL
jgi:GxxExxY protein